MKRLMIVAAAMVLAGCTTLPTGPSMLVLPGTGRNFDEFRADDAQCRQYAQDQVSGVTAERASVDAGVKSAVVGTVIGAAAGAAIGGHRGAGVGAGTGLLIGSAAGAESASLSGYGAQRRYDNAFIQCMYAHGHRVPVSGNYSPERPRQPYYPPPPPPGYQQK
ncbi:MAG: hypothetical protein E6R11_01500 [Rhodocyclaceae bacterium]|jgi:hypothetical protein|nr:MAG: hypothetical protein E6R11_01500 [Rhodocyclaceae bacterium]HNB04377.1 glycine zipper family protein [Thauera aminoaromatica]